MKHWLVKSEPETYSFDQLRKDKKTAWTGVRNYTARNFLRAMTVNDVVFFYHSVTEKAVVGLALVVKAAYPDPTVEAGEKGDWVCVDLRAAEPLTRRITLDEIKANPKLKDMALLRLSRLSVQPVTEAEAAELQRMAAGKTRR